jgi:ethanolamine utilization protein EutP (predicted NTPase)
VHISGKSTFINSLLGGEYLETGVLPTTDKVCVLRNGTSTKTDAWKNQAETDIKDLEVRDVPVQWLDSVAIIDTPGVNAMIKRHEKLTTAVLPRCDLVIFLTSAERPISDSEAAFLGKIRNWGKKVIAVINKRDVLRTEAEIDQVKSYVTHNVTSVLGTVRTIPVFLVSSRLALNAKIASQGIDPSLGPGAKSWHESHLGDFESFLKKTLGEKHIVAEKLENALNVADNITNQAITRLNDHKASLESDQRILEFIDENMALFLLDLNRDVQLYKGNVDKIIESIREKTNFFLNQKVSIFNPHLLLDSDAFRKEFEKDVLFEISKPVDDILEDIGKLVSQRSRVHAQTIVEYVGNRPKKYANNVGVAAPNQTEYDGLRAIIVEKTKNSVSDVILAHNHTKNVSELADSIKTALQAAAAIELASATTLGGLVMVHMLDVTTMIASSSAIVVGTLVLPWRRNALQREFDEKLKVLKKNLDEAISANLERELLNVNTRITESVGPYRRFVITDQERVLANLEVFKHISSSIRGIRSSIVK